MNTRDLTYQEALKCLYDLQKYGIKFGLSKTSNLLKRFGNPHHGQRYLHVAGTNGKGSMAAMVASILKETGLKVGLYSSPHLARFTERFRINGREMAPEKAAALTAEVMDAIDPRHPPTFFEVVTAMALIHFAREKTDMAIMEVGMGGRLDATNVIRPKVSVITNISLEHQFFLGSRLTDIAAEKAGIIKQGVDLVTAATQSPVLDLFRRRCHARKAPFWRVGKDVRYRTGQGRFSYYGLDRKILDVELGLPGRFQARNAALSLAVVELLERKGMGVSEEEIRQGVKHPHWPGRMQIISRNPLVILDGAHNPDAVRHLKDAVRQGFPYRRLILVLGVMEDKDIRQIVRAIVPLADYVIYSRPEYYRAASPETLMKAAAPLARPGEIEPLLARALRKAREMAGPQDLVLVTGSLFTVGEALSCLDPEGHRADDLK